MFRTLEAASLRWMTDLKLWEGEKFKDGFRLLSFSEGTSAHGTLII